VLLERVQAQLEIILLAVMTVPLVAMQELLVVQVAAVVVALRP
jgi:hypothetical protein